MRSVFCLQKHWICNADAVPTDCGAWGRSRPLRSPCTGSKMVTFFRFLGAVTALVAPAFQHL